MPSPVKSQLARRADAAGILAAGANLPLTFQRTLMPRGAIDQAIVTGLSISTNHALVSLAQESINALSLSLLRRRRRCRRPRRREPARVGVRRRRGGRGSRRAKGAATNTRRTTAPRRASHCELLVVGHGRGRRHRRGPRRHLHLSGRDRRRSISILLAATGGLAAAGEWGRRHRAHLDSDLAPEDAKASTARGLAFGLGVSLGTSALAAIERHSADRVARGLARVLPGEAAVWQPVGHAVALGAATALGRLASQKAFAHLEAKEGGVETAFDIAPPSAMLSGSRESYVPFPTLSLQGRRFVWMVTPRDIIENVTGSPAVAQPIRAYVGLESAPTEEERVELALRELDRTGAFDRSWLMVVSPTGTGYVNYAAVSTLEFLSRGDCATVAMQYAARPSVLSLRRVAEGRAHMQLLLDGIQRRLADRPSERRPRIVMFGESLGAWTSQDPFVDRGTQGMIDAGIDHAIWIGTPHFSKWKEQVLRDDRPDVDRSLVGVFNEISEWHTTDEHARDRLRFVMITHHDDGVALFGPELTIQSPSWLGPPATRPSSVPKGMRWMPTTTFFQVLTDMKNSATVVPGVFAAKGHDYRADLLPFFNAVLGFDESPTILTAIGDWLEKRELLRTEWIRRHGDAGRSLSVAVLERLLEEERADGHDADAALLRVMREVVAAPEPPA